MPQPPVDIDAMLDKAREMTLERTIAAAMRDLAARQRDLISTEDTVYAGAVILAIDREAERREQVAAELALELGK